MSALIFGKTGSGKSYYAVKHYLIPSLKSGRSVFTNLDFGHKPEFNWIASYRFSEYLGQDCRLQLNIFRKHTDLLDKIKLDLQEDLEGESLRIPKHSTVIFDEAQMCFDYLSVNRMDKRIYNFLAYARHFDIEMIYLTQSPELLSKFIQGLANEIIKIKNLGTFGLGKKTMKIFHYQYVHSFEPDSTTLEKYDTQIFSLYRSSIVPESQNKPKIPFVVIAVIGFAILLFILRFVMKTGGKTYF